MSSRGMRPPGDDWPPGLAAMREELDEVDARRRAAGVAPLEEPRRPPVRIESGPRQSGRTHRHLERMIAELGGGRAGTVEFVSMHSPARDYSIRLFVELAPSARYVCGGPPTFELKNGARVFFRTVDEYERPSHGRWPLPLYVDHDAVEEMARRWLRNRGLE